MRKLFLLLLTLSTSLFFCSANSMPVNDNGAEIVITQKGLEPQPTPRTPANIPFTAVLYDTYVLLGSLGDHGEVSVELTSTAGDNYSTSFDTADGAILIPVSGNAGYYVLTIITQSGQEFVGEFNI